VPSPLAVLAMESAASVKKGVRWTIQFLDAESCRCGSVDTAYGNRGLGLAYASYSDMHACIHEVDDSFLSGHPPSLNLPN